MCKSSIAPNPQRLKEPITEQTDDAEKFLAELEKLIERGNIGIGGAVGVLFGYLPQYILLFFGAAAIFFGSFNIYRLVNSIQEFLISLDFNGLLLALGILAVGTAYISLFRRIFYRQRNKVTDDFDERLREVSVLGRRLAELKELRSSNFEEIMKKSRRTVSDVYFGRAQAILNKRERIKCKTLETRRLQHRRIAA